MKAKYMLIITKNQRDSSAGNTEIVDWCSKMLLIFNFTIS